MVNYRLQPMNAASLAKTAASKHHLSPRGGALLVGVLSLFRWARLILARYRYFLLPTGKLGQRLLKWKRELVDGREFPPQARPDNFESSFVHRLFHRLHQ
jgi:hypothetical protein